MDNKGDQQLNEKYSFQISLHYHLHFVICTVHE
jgi:hypothetical protein